MSDIHKKEERVKGVTHLGVRGAAVVDAVEIWQTGFIQTLHSKHTHFCKLS